ncbi:MAG: 7,8-didemethyl-8-hydroxy-5-deazariboflavin synthase subunit CofG, partial [Cyanobacteria bacterium P01_E01_bin.45]
MQAVNSSFVSPSIVTYSAAYTLVPTYECFNRCSYCNFRAEPGAGWISLSEAKKQLIS